MLLNMYNFDGHQHHLIYLDDSVDRTPWKYSLNVVYQGRSSILWALSGRLTCKSYCRNWVIRSLISVVMFSIEFVYKINEGCWGKRLIHQHCWYWFCHYTPCMLLDVWTSYSWVYHFHCDKMFYVLLLIWEECQLWEKSFLRLLKKGVRRWIGWVVDGWHGWYSTSGCEIIFG